MLTAQRLPTAGFTWDDLHLPDDQTRQLRAIQDRVVHGRNAQVRWRLGNRILPKAGITALFVGSSGTGKTIAAQVLAGELGVDAYRIDLSQVTSRYIGETEKNLSGLLDRARATDALLFFDEADALFAKRSEVRDSKDRYANLEIGYLLGEMEGYDGVSILATKRTSDLDAALVRRLTFQVRFPLPGEEGTVRTRKRTP